MGNFANRSTPRGGQALIGVLVTVAIIIAVAGFYLSAKGKNPDGSASTKTALRRSLDLGQEVVLQSNLQQIRTSLVLYKDDNNGKVPPTYDELKKAVTTNPEFWINPVDKKPLGYDPNTGLMIVTPYEGMSRNIIAMTTPPAAESGDGSTPAAAPGMPVVPTVSAAPGEDDGSN